MSLKDARQFLIDFKCNPNLALALSKISIDNFKKNNKIIVSFAKQKGYSFNLNELKEANKFKNKKLDENELKNVFGGVNLNSNALKKANLTLKSISNILKTEL